MLIPDWQVIFMQSKANDAPYDGDKLPVNAFPLPRGTWFQQRLDELRKERTNEQD